MLETAVLGGFIAALAVCVVSGVSVVWALAAGYVIFFSYAVLRGYRPGEVFRMSLRGVKTVRNILMIFGLIGLITALWRAAGTIPVIVCWSANFVNPSAFLLIVFLLNCLVSVLTGTSFGTGATMGVICMAMANAMKINPLLTGGAILSGIYFGDRCSPVSSSANLVCELTGTDIYDNIRGMIKTSAVPFAVACIVYFMMGISAEKGGELPDIKALFSGNFSLSWPAVIPAAAILILSLFRVRVKKTMIVSIICSVLICFFQQKMSMGEILSTAVFGYRAANPQLSAMLDGGGILSMVKVTVIVSLSSSYAGIFETTGLLDGLQKKISEASRRITPFGGTFLVGILTSMIACNQTLAVMLTAQLCRESEPDAGRFAIYLENTAIILAPLVPWSIAGAVPLAAVGAPTASVAAACYLYMVPLWNFFVSLAARGRKKERQL